MTLPQLRRRRWRQAREVLAATAMLLGAAGVVAFVLEAAAGVSLIPQLLGAAL